MFALTPIALALFGLPSIVSTPPASIVAAGAYATGLASVANGVTFGLRSADDRRLFVYRRVDSATADLIGVQPYTNRSAIDSVISSIQNLPMAVLPVLDFDTVYAYYGMREFGNLAAGSPSPTLNQLAGTTGSMADFYTNGGATTIPSSGSSEGGTNGIRMQIPATGASASSYLYIDSTILAGRWVLAFDARCNPAGAPTQTLQYGVNALNGLSTASLTTAWQTFTMPLTLTATTHRNIVFVQGEYPAAPTVASDIDLCNFRLMPGLTYPAQVSTAPMPVRLDQLNDFVMGASHQLTSSVLNAFTAKLNGLTTFATWSYLGSLDTAGTVAVGVFLSSILGSSASATYLSSNAQTDSGQNLYDTQFSRGNGETYKFRMALTGLSTFGITYDGTSLNYYHNGLLMCSYVVSHAMANICKLGFGANCAFGSALLPFTGLRSGETFWSSALTPTQMSAAHSVAVARLAAKSLTLASQPNVVLCEGDSITVGSGDTLGIGFANRAMSLITGKTLNGENRAVSGSTLISGLGGRAAADDVVIARFIAAGKRVIMPVLIGTNDRPATQATADTYYTDLCTYYAARRTAGAKVIASTLIPCAQTAAYDSTSMTAVGGPLNGNTYNGMRNYISARLKSDATKYDALVDYAALTQFTTWSSTYFNDDAHPNTAGHAILAAALAPVIQTLLL